MSTSPENYRLGCVGTVTPPADMMQAARLSLTPTGFENLMLRTGGRAPTPGELVEFADAERAAGIVHAHESNCVGDIAADAVGVAADMRGTVTDGEFPTLTEALIPAGQVTDIAPLTSAD